MWTARFWRDLAERVLASAAGGAFAALGIDASGAASDLNWKHILIGAGVAAAVSLLKGLIAANVGDKTSASLVE